MIPTDLKIKLKGDKDWSYKYFQAMEATTGGVTHGMIKIVLKNVRPGNARFNNMAAINPIIVDRTRVPAAQKNVLVSDCQKASLLTTFA